VRARVHARREGLEEAEHLAREAVLLAGRSDFLDGNADAFLDLADVLRLGGRRDEATAAAGEALELYERKGNVVGAARARAALA